MLTTTPRLSPCEGATPSPATRNSPLGCTSATTAITLAVPISRPTTRSLYSLAIFSSVPLDWLAGGLRAGGGHTGRHASNAHRVTVGVAQVGIFERATEARSDLRDGGDEALGACRHFVGRAASELDLGAVPELCVPVAALGQRERLQLRVEPGEHWRQRVIEREHLPRAARGAG